MIWMGGMVAVLGTGTMVMLSLIGLDSPLSLIIPFFVYSVGSGFLVPNSLAGGLTSVEPAAAGSAAALGGFLQMGAGFVSTLVVAALIQTSFLQVGTVMLVCTSFSLLIFVVLVRSRRSA